MENGIESPIATNYHDDRHTPTVQDDKFTILEKMCDDNFEYFKNHDKSDASVSFQNTFKQWANFIQSARWKCEKVEEFAAEYDFDANTPGNGFRSFITIVNAAVKHGIRVCENLNTTKTRYLFRKSTHLKEITAFKDLFASLCTCLDYLFILHEFTADEYGGRSLFTKSSAEEIFELGGKIDQYCFYGRCVGFQYTESMRSILRGLSICMASYSESYFSKANKLARTTSSAWISNKYFWNPELKAKRIVNISHSATIGFCKSFWFLAESEIMHALPSIFGSSIEVNNVINIPPESIQLENVETGELVAIPIPSSHLPVSSVPVRLLSSRLRQGALGASNKKSSLLPPSQHLVIHCHGGGFVAQSSKSHELYLRDWAVALNAPILSIDYSLAPEAPYPRALEEVFYVYCWALRNASYLGTTAQKVVLAGDSAGANLCIATIFKCIDFGLRKPDGLFMAYCPVYLDFVPSPARMLSLMDPLLPFGFLIRCMKAYACVDQKAKEAKYKQPNASPAPITNRKEEAGDEVDNAKSAFDYFSNYTNNDDITRRFSTNSSSNFMNEDEKTVKSLLSDATTSNTFASASYHSDQEVAENNTDLMTPDIASSCISFEDDSQPIMKLNAETLSNISSPPADSDDKNITTAFLLQECNGNHYQNNYHHQENQTTITKTPSEENVIINVGSELLSPRTLQARLHKAATDFVEMVTTTLKSFTNSSEIQSEHSSQNASNYNGSQSNSEEMTNLDALIARNLGDEFDFQVPKNLYISPYIAPDEYLRQMPRTNILTIDMDPCLDDGVMFAKRLKNVGTPVKIDILHGLPHGFLNFTMLSKEANEASKICANRIAELLNDKHDSV